MHTISYYFQALQALDPKSTGKIHVEVFRRILDNFCFKLSAEQFKHVLASVNILDGDMVDYLSFIESFRERDLNMEVECIDNSKVKTILAYIPSILSGFFS